VNKSHPFAGLHLVLSFNGCDYDALRNASGLRHALEQAAIAVGATILRTSDNIFPNGGYTAVLLLAESHASLHTYPEHDACFLDFFTCSSSAETDRFTAVMQAHLQPKDVHVVTLHRGVSASMAVPQSMGD